MSPVFFCFMPFFIKKTKGYGKEVIVKNLNTFFINFLLFL